MSTENEMKEAAAQEVTSPVLSQEESKRDTVSDSKPISKTDKLTEKLKILCEKRDKAITAQTAAEKKTKEINEQILKIRKELHNDEIRALDLLCNNTGITFSDITDFITALTEKMSLSEAAALLELKVKE